jgi:hypothetical protein
MARLIRKWVPLRRRSNCSREWKRAHEGFHGVLIVRR